MRARGFSLLEVMVTLGLMFMALWVTFSLFERGTRAFSLGDAQNDLAGDARRSLLAVSPDIRMADADTLLVEDSPLRSAPNEAGVSTRRDGFCLATLSDWVDPDNFNLVQAGVYWDTYTVVYATRKPRGVLCGRPTSRQALPTRRRWPASPATRSWPTTIRAMLTSNPPGS